MLRARGGLLIPLLACVAGLALGLAAAPNPVAEAERRADSALAQAATRPEAALAEARAALALTAEFEPTAFVTAGRKGEVVEDEYQAAREAYRRHRARLYHAMGESLLGSGRPLEAARYLRRAVALERSTARASSLSRALTRLGRGAEAIDVLLAAGAVELPAEALAAAEAAADAARIPSLQAEIDRARLLALPVEPKPEPREGPLRLPDRARLSTGAPFRADAEGITLLYVSEPACRTCSADLETLGRVGSGARIVMAPAGDDEALRRVLRLYRHEWPVLLGPGASASLSVPPPALLVVARRGWSLALLRPPFAAALPAVLELFSRNDVQETPPRGAWDSRPPARRSLPPQPGPLPDGFLPGEDEPAPQEFADAVAAFRGGKPAEALRLFDGLAARQDGWLLPPEARLDRALCLAALGRRDEARRLLLRIGDSRAQDAVDRALEGAAGASR